MYKVFCNDKLLCNDRYETLKIFEASVVLELGKTGLFEFTIYPDHPYYDEVKEMIAIVEVQRDEKTIFSGRVLNIEYGFYNEKQVSCEGELAFLLDSLMPPHTYGSSFSGYLEYVIEEHNNQVETAKHFRVGSVTVGDFSPFPVVENLNYINCLETLNKRMVEPSGGYLAVRNEGGIRYLDLLSQAANASNKADQKIILGKNLLDIKRSSNSEDVFSCIVPLGAKEEDSEIRIDIKNVNSGLPYIENAEAVAVYGKIYREVIFDNITVSSTLLSEAREYLRNNFAGISTVEISAVDLAAVDTSLDHFNVGEWVEVYDKVHFAETPQTFLIRKMAIDLLDPGKTKITIGKVKKGLTESILGLSDSISRPSGGSSGGSASSSEPEEVQQPYLIDSGTTGIWKWKKFSDGTGEFFGKIPVTSANVQTAFSGWYRGATLYGETDYEYPFQMTEAPALNVTFQTRNGQGALPWVFSIDAATAQRYVPQVYLIRPTATTGILGNINIIGKGKL